MSVYGVTHTSVDPLVTFTVQRNPTTKKIEVVATRTAAVDIGTTVNLRVYSVETGTRD
jgi:methylglyoxal synthase